MDLYQVERVGVYRQGMLGIFSSLDAAKAAVEQHIASCAGTKHASDADGHHDYTITRTALDALNADASSLGWYTAHPRSHGGLRTPYRWEEAV